MKWVEWEIVMQQWFSATCRYQKRVECGANKYRIFGCWKCNLLKINCEDVSRLYIFFFVKVTTKFSSQVMNCRLVGWQNSCRQSSTFTFFHSAVNFSYFFFYFSSNFCFQLQWRVARRSLWWWLGKCSSWKIFLSSLLVCFNSLTINHLDRGTRRRMWKFKVDEGVKRQWRVSIWHMKHEKNFEWNSHEKLNSFFFEANTKQKLNYYEFDIMIVSAESTDIICDEFYDTFCSLFWKLNFIWEEMSWLISFIYFIIIKREQHSNLS